MRLRGASPSLDQNRCRRDPLHWLDPLAPIAPIGDGHYLVPLFAHYRAAAPLVQAAYAVRLTLFAIAYLLSRVATRAST